MYSLSLGFIIENGIYASNIGLVTGQYIQAVIYIDLMPSTCIKYIGV